MDILDGAIKRAEAAGTEQADDATNTLIIGFAFGGMALAALALFVPPVSIVAAVALAALARPPPQGGREVRGPADPALADPRPLCQPEAVAQRKLVLVVVDSLRADMLLRTVEAGDAPTFKRAARARASWSPTASRRFPSVTPVCTSEITHRGAARRALHPGDELVPPGRGPLRRVRVVVRGDPRVRPLPLALRHGLQPQHGPPQPRGADRLRAARRRRPAHRRHAVSDLPRPDPPRGRPRGAAQGVRLGGEVPPRGLGPRRALLRRALLEPAGGLHADARPPGDPRRLLGLRRAATWSSTTSTTSCSSRCPTTTTTPTATGPRSRARRSRSPTTR